MRVRGPLRVRWPVDRDTGPVVVPRAGRRRVERLERRLDRHCAVEELARTALTGGPLSALLDRAVDLVARVLPARSCCVLELSAAGDVRLVAAAGEACDRPAAANGEGLDLLVRSALRSAAPLTVLEPAAPDVRATDAGTARRLLVRIDGHRQPYGVLSAYAVGSRLLEPEELDFVSRVAAVLTLAITRRHSDEAGGQSALHDPLTGLPSRPLLVDRLDQAIALARRCGESVGVLRADLAGFSALTDAVGSAAGDAVLVGVAERLRGCLRASDTVARLGGDEFAVCLPRIATVAEAADVAAKLCTSLDRPLRLGELSVPLSASVGVAVFPEHGAGAAVVLQRADEAMCAAKITRRPVATYAPSAGDRGSRRLSLTAELALAIENDELELDYQPLVDLTSGAVASVEALVRWRDADGDILSASDLVFLAEHSGMMRALSAWVLDRAVRQIAQWQRRGISLRVAVNVSGVVLEDFGFLDQLAQTLQLARLAPGRLSLEITESVILSEHARAALTRLAESGVTISIDDFGTGYASLSYLKHLPASQLKVDRSFVTRVAEDPRDLAIVRSVVELAHALGLQVVVEGVEDAAAAELLRGLSADLAQGYLYSRPVPPDQLAAWLLGRPTAGGYSAGQLPLPEVAATTGS